jgi:hypothetical protein
VDGHQRRGNVEVIIPDLENVEGITSSSVVDNASSAALDGKYFVEKKAIALMQPEMARDRKRHANSLDPGWKYGFWADTPMRKEYIQCVFCNQTIYSGVNMFKQHLTRGFDDSIKCQRALEVVRNEMHAYIALKSRSVLFGLAHIYL